MNPDQISSHLARFRESEKSQADKVAAEKKAAQIHIEVMSSRLSDRLKSDALPLIEDAVRALRSAGVRAASSFTPSNDFGFGKWMIVATIKFRASTPEKNGQLFDLTFIGEVDEDEDFWRVGSSAIGLRHQIPDSHFLPGNGVELKDFVSDRIKEVIEAVFPVS